MDDHSTLCHCGTGPHREHDRSMTQADGGLSLFLPNGKQVPSAPEIMTLTVDELPGRLSRLRSQLRLLVADPAELRYRVRSRHFRSCPSRGDKRDASIRRVDRQVDMLDVLATDGDGNVTQLDRLHHQYPGWFLMSSKR